MDRASYTAVQRRAANQVWDAAENYDFEPLFIASFKLLIHDNHANNSL